MKRNNTLRIHYYITAHGYGHGVRSCDIIRALARRHPEFPVTVSTDLPELFLRNRMGDTPYLLCPGGFDVGMVQKDSVQIDLDASLRCLERLAVDRRRLVEGEMARLRSEDASIIVCDIPSIPIEAAKAIGIPALAVGNFSWDWIYDMMEPRGGQWGCFARMCEEGYAQADALLRLPFHCPMPAFKKIVDMPLLAEPGQADRERLASLTGADPAKSWVLLSFTTLDWDVAALKRIKGMREFEFFSILPLEWKGSGIHAVDRCQMSFVDTLASCDFVVTKPGFGIVSDCVANRKPMVYSERDHFAEFDYLAASIERHLVAAKITQEQLYAADLAAALVDVMRRSGEMSRKEPVPMGGADVAAKRIVESLTIF